MSKEAKDGDYRSRPIGLRSIFSALLIAAVFIGVVSFFAAPWIAFRALRAAAVAQDVQGMTELMDMGAVRGSLRAQLGGSAPKPPPALVDDPVGALRGMMGGRLPGEQTDVEAYLTPPMIAWYAHGGPKEAEAPFRAGDLLPGMHDSEMRFWAPSRSRIAVTAQGEPDKESIFTFERKGIFKWRLVHIRLPATVGP